MLVNLKQRKKNKVSLCLNIFKHFVDNVNAYIFVTNHKINLLEFLDLLYYEVIYNAFRSN